MVATLDYFLEELELGDSLIEFFAQLQETELSVEVVRGEDLRTQQLVLDALAALIREAFYQGKEGVPKEEESDEKGDTAQEYDSMYVPEAIRAEILVFRVPNYFVDNFATEFPWCQN
jgi:hypothetical protein